MFLWNYFDWETDATEMVMHSPILIQIQSVPVASTLYKHFILSPSVGKSNAHTQIKKRFPIQRTNIHGAGFIRVNIEYIRQVYLRQPWVLRREDDRKYIQEARMDEPPQAGVMIQQAYIYVYKQPPPYKDVYIYISMSV